jgi:D-serine deaminase-like pyridoxal phosphate-dependent protein
MKVTELETPALLIDLDIMERNLARGVEYARANDLALRPHTKTHKIPELARRQLAGGAAGLTVAKVGEAEVMIEAEPQELLVAYPVIGRRKLERLLAVGRRTKLLVALDHLLPARQLSDAAREVGLTIGVLAEIDVGLGRVGVTVGPELVQLVEGLARLPRLTFEGIAFYPGHIRGVDEPAQRALDQVGERVREALTALRRAGFEARIVSGGSTPTLFHSHRVRELTEIRPGTYIFNDRNTLATGACTLADCAASILLTVVSTARPDQIIIDGGSKTFSSDRHLASPEASFGYVVEAPGAVFTKMNEEHGYIDVRRAEREFSVGDRLRVIPNHICTAMNLHEAVYGVRGDVVEQIWKVEARGKLQ